jgi:hypothetical protein
MMTEFCSVDRRLLATGYVPLIDRARAPQIAERRCAGRQGADRARRAIRRASRPATASWTRCGRRRRRPGLPILFHVGGEEKMHRDYLENGLPYVKDFHGGDENFTSLTFMAIPLSVWQTLSALVIDGVFDRFPELKFGADRTGRLLASQPDEVPGFRRAPPSARRSGCRASPARRRRSCAGQLRVTPYPHEDVRWIMENSARTWCCSPPTSRTSRAAAIR